jgi:hypothetical protein
LRKTEEIDDDSVIQTDLMKEIDFFHNSKNASDETLGISKVEKKITEDIEKYQEGN